MAVVKFGIQYLLGMMPYYTYCAQIGEQRYDMPEIEAFLVFSENSPAGDLLDSLIADIFPGLEEPCRIRRFAYFAKNCFQRAAELLCNQKTDSIPSSLEGISGRWSLEENVFRDLIRTCFFLSDSSTYFSAREQARFRNALLSSKMWAKDHATASDRLFLMLRNNFGPVRLEDIYKIIGNKGLLLDYFVYEIVEDAIICGAVTAIDSHIWERYVNWLPKQGKSDLIMFLRTHRQWGNRDHIPPEHYSRRIDEILLGPVIDKLSMCSRLAIVPSNYLHNIPFHALDTIFDLIKSGQLREIIYLPSIRSLVNLNKRRPKPRSALRCLFVGHSDANDIAINDELEIVRARFPDTTSLIDKDATIESVISAMPKYDVIHFACHGRFDKQRNCSYLVLANGNFYPEQVLKLKGFSPELVFTNACIAGVVSLASSRGDQTLGLHTALLLSGARQVIATMWEVDDKVACQFAAHFYTTWLDKLECSTAEVVLETQRMLKKQYEDIFFWGGHALFGDWR